MICADHFSAHNAARTYNSNILKSLTGGAIPGPDAFADGLTDVALVPFVASGSRLGTFIPIPYFGAFPESNIRLYSIDNAGRHGLLFRS